MLSVQVVTLQEQALDAPLLGPGEPPMLAELQALAQRYAHQRTRAELGQAWRPGLSRLHKLMASLEAWLGYCPAKQRRQFLQSLQPMLQAAWGLHAQEQVFFCCPTAVCLSARAGVASPAIGAFPAKCMQNEGKMREIACTGAIHATGDTWPMSGYDVAHTTAYYATDYAHITFVLHIVQAVEVYLPKVGVTLLPTCCVVFLSRLMVAVAVGCCGW